MREEEIHLSGLFLYKLYYLILNLYKPKFVAHMAHAHQRCLACPLHKSKEKGVVDSAEEGPPLKGRNKEAQIISKYRMNLSSTLHDYRCWSLVAPGGGGGI